MAQTWLLQAGDDTTWFVKSFVAIGSQRRGFSRYMRSNRCLSKLGYLPEVSTLVRNVPLAADRADVVAATLKPKVDPKVSRSSYNKHHLAPSFIPTPIHQDAFNNNGDTQNRREQCHDRPSTLHNWSDRFQCPNDELTTVQFSSFF